MARTQTAPRVQPRIYPAGRAVVFHGFGAPQLAGRRFVVDGRRFVAVRFGRLALLISFVDQAAYAPDEIERRRADSDWFRTEARYHERAVARASAMAPFVPGRLLTVFSHPLALEETAAESYARWSRSLTRLGGKREFTLHVFAGPHAAPGGEPYLLRVAARATRSTRVPTPKLADDVAGALEEVRGSCEAQATALRRIAGAPARGLIAAVVYLVDEEKCELLKMLVTKAALAGKALGLTYYLEGPRAPFSFV